MKNDEIRTLVPQTETVWFWSTFHHKPVTGRMVSCKNVDGSMLAEIADVTADGTPIYAKTYIQCSKLFESKARLLQARRQTERIVTSWAFEETFATTWVLTGQKDGKTYTQAVSKPVKENGREKDLFIELAQTTFPVNSDTALWGLLKTYGILRQNAETWDNIVRIRLFMDYGVPTIPEPKPELLP